MALSQKRFHPNRETPESEVLLGKGYLPQKELNAKLIALQLLTQDYSLETMPQWVGFTTTTFCNLRCVQCQTHGTEEQREQYNQKRWPRERLRRLAKECLPSAYDFNLTNTGEPLATPRLKEHLAELGQYGAKLTLTTNGTLLSKDKLVDLLPVVGKVGISLDGASKLTVERLRVGVNFEQLLTNIRLLTRTCELLPRASRPSISLLFVLMGSNIREMPRMVQLAHALKVPVVTFSFVIVFYPHLQEEAVERHKALYNAYYQHAQREANRLNIRIHALRPPFPSVAPDADAPIGGKDMIIQEWPEDYYQTLPLIDSLLDQAAIEAAAAEIADTVKRHFAELKAATKNINLYELRQMQDAFKEALQRNQRELKRLAAGADERIRYCEHLHNRTFIGISGNVAPCCLPGRPVLGHVDNNTVREIWNGEAYQDFRRRFHSAHPPDCCKNCHFVRYKPKHDLLDKITPEVNEI